MAGKSPVIPETAHAERPRARYRWLDQATKELVRSLRADLGLSQERLAHLLGVSVRTIARWEAGAVEPDPEIKNRILRLKRIVGQRLETTRDPEAVMSWLTSPQWFECNPLDLLSSRRAEQILRIK
jgi:DNA-binding transcriptional regulator YiaG